MIWITQYLIEGERYGSYVEAPTEADAECLIQQRGMGEEIIGTRETPPESTAPGTGMRLLHQVCFWSHIALKSGTATVDEVLGDRGVLHEVVHHLEGSGDDITASCLMEKVAWLQSRVPGLATSVSVSDSIGEASGSS